MNHRDCIGLGVAGNFTGHLEQAGEARDFAHLTVADAAAPKGLFPFYVPAATGAFIESYPLSSTRIRIPEAGGDLQIEPEVVLRCELDWTGGELRGLRPTRFGAYNDCSIRRPGARKISEKKNWGPDSKGISEQLLPIDRFAPGGVLDRFRLACFLRRDGELHAYGEDSPVAGYSYFHGRLLDWMLERMRAQRDEGPLEDIPALLERAGRPRVALISIGATRYTPYGEHTFLRAGDEALVLVYDAERVADPRALLAPGEPLPAGAASLLRQHVDPPPSGR